MVDGPLRDRWRGASMMLCDGMSWRHRVPPVIFQNNGVGRHRGVTPMRYVDEEDQLFPVPFIVGLCGMVFQQDNSRAHSARLTHDFLYR